MLPATARSFLHKYDNKFNGIKGFVTRSLFQRCKNVRRKEDFGIYLSNKCNFARAMSTHRVLKPVRVFPQEQKDELMSVYPDIVRDLTNGDFYQDVRKMCERFDDLMDYTLLDGSKFLGCTTVTAYKMMEKQENLTPENIRLANILGWCMEMHITNIIMENDFYDKSEIRRGKPCWYKVDNSGIRAFNDAMFIGQGLFVLLQKYFSDHPFYFDMVELMNDGYFRFTYGTAVDLNDTRENMSGYKFRILQKYLSATYTFMIPCTLAMYFSKVYTPELYKQIYPILYDLGAFFYVENGMWDVFADAEITGKIGNDIEEGKCNWVHTTAYKKANEKQRKLLTEHYGKSIPESVKKIRDVYEELDIIGEFFAYRDRAYKQIKKDIDQLPNENMHTLLTDFADKLLLRKYLD